MISRNQISFIHSLYIDKYRKKHKLFIAEGEKTVSELLDSDLKIEKLYCTHSFKENKTKTSSGYSKVICEISLDELRKLSLMKTPNQALALVHLPEPEELPSLPEKELMLMVDRLQDPGNMGTILRTADWFGIGHIICSPDSVDAFNSKVVQASMGSFLRVKVHYHDLAGFFKGPGKNCKVYGTFKDGKNLYQEKLPGSAIILIGNESSGISPDLDCFIHHPISIPAFENKPGRKRPESLNAAISAAIVCAEFRRQNL